MGNCLLPCLVNTNLRFIFGILDTKKLVIKRSSSFFRHSECEGMIDLLDVSSLELSEEKFERFLFFHDHNTAGRISIYSMQKSGFKGQRMILCTKIIKRYFNERCLIGFMISRMHIDTRRLTEHEKHIVFIEDILFCYDIGISWCLDYFRRLLQCGNLFI